jgi:hypothetical protein
MSKTEINNLYKSQHYSRSNRFSEHMGEYYERDNQLQFRKYSGGILKISWDSFVFRNTNAVKRLFNTCIYRYGNNYYFKLMWII